MKKHLVMEHQPLYAPETTDVQWQRVGPGDHGHGEWNAMSESELASYTGAMCPVAGGVPKRVGGVWVWEYDEPTGEVRMAGKSMVEMALGSLNAAVEALNRLYGVPLSDSTLFQIMTLIPIFKRNTLLVPGVVTDADREIVVHELRRIAERLQFEVLRQAIMDIATQIETSTEQAPPPPA